MGPTEGPVSPRGPPSPRGAVLPGPRSTAVQTPRDSAPESRTRNITVPPSTRVFTPGVG